MKKIETIKDACEAYSKLPPNKKALVCGLMQGLMWSGKETPDALPEEGQTGPGQKGA